VSQIFLEDITNYKKCKQKDTEIRIVALTDQLPYVRGKYEETSRRAQQNHETNSKARWHEKLHGLIKNAVKTLLFHPLPFTIQMSDTFTECRTNKIILSFKSNRSKCRA